MICILVVLSLLEWKPLVKMKLVVDLCLGNKVWDTLFYLPGESDVGASWVFSVTTLEFLEGGSVAILEDVWTITRLTKGCSIGVTRSSLGTQWINGLDNPSGAQLFQKLSMVLELNMVYGAQHVLGSRHGLWNLVCSRSLAWSRSLTWSMDLDMVLELSMVYGAWHGLRA